jgi:hypothetical protein
MEQIWLLVPDWRAGQLWENVFGCGRQSGGCIFHIEDDETEEKLNAMLKRLTENL